MAKKDAVAEKKNDNDGKSEAATSSTVVEVKGSETTYVSDLSIKPGVFDTGSPIVISGASYFGISIETEGNMTTINRMKDYGACVSALERFLPYIDNWAVNDALNPACFRKHRGELIGRIQSWIASEAPYTRRCGMRLLMANYLDKDFRPEYLDLPADLRSEEYYVNMMTAWLFAEALAKQWDAAVPYIETRRLDPWTHNRAIQKACESFRVPEEHKTYLRTLKVRADGSRKVTAPD